MRSSNPALSSNTFTELYGSEQPMTLSGTVNKSAILLALVMAGAGIVWKIGYMDQNIGTAVPLLLVGLVGGLIMSLVTIFKKSWAPVTAPLYAALEGLFIGGISVFFEIKYPGIVMQAVALTFATFGCLLLAYKSGAIKATENFKLGIVAATGAIAVLYLVNFVMGFFGTNISFINGGGWMGIGFSVVVTAIAALNLVLDFDFIEQGAEQGAPKYMEWYAAFGLTVTLVWLYIEMLRLLSKLRR